MYRCYTCGITLNTAGQCPNTSCAWHGRWQLGGMAVADLHPEVLALIEAGPQLVPRSKAMATKLFTHTQESPQAFARRCVEFTVEKELEELELVGWMVGDECPKEVYPTLAEASSHGNEPCQVYAIRRRGKP